MAEVIAMPRLSDTMEEGVVAEWHQKVGDQIKTGDLLAEIETDKATMDFESYLDGVLLYIGVETGQTAAVDTVLAIIGEKGEDYKPALETFNAQHGEATQKEEPKAETAPPAPAVEKAVAAPAAEPIPTQIVSATTTGNGRLKASPLAKKMAEEKGIDIAQVKGTGDDGRIVKRDIENFTPSAATSTEVSASINLPQVVGQESFDEVAISQMRKTIARRLAESKFSAPHFYLTMEINMDKAIEARKSMNEVSPVKISFNDMVIRAAAGALRQNPAVNSSWLGDRIRTNHHIHIGVAVAVDEGLLVPVIRFADNKSLSHIAAEVKELAGKAKDRKLSLEEMQGNTFSISNLGMFGIDEFTAIINPPDACIMAVGAIKQVPALKNGELYNSNIMKVTLSCDHRVVDGASGSKFLQTFKNLLEDPVRILI